MNRSRKRTSSRLFQDPSESGLIRKVERKGRGDGILFAVDLVDRRLVTEVEGSEASLAMAGRLFLCPANSPPSSRSLPGCRSPTSARPPRRWPTSAKPCGGSASAAARSGPPTSSSTDKVARLSEPAGSGANRRGHEELRRKNPDRDGWTTINLMDEPGFEFDHVDGCPNCRQGFMPYLKSLGLADQDIAKLKITNDPNGAGREEKASYYYTRLYMKSDYDRDAPRGDRERPAAPARRANDDEFRLRAAGGQPGFPLRGLVRDLRNRRTDVRLERGLGRWARTRQVNGFYLDVMRSACRKPGLNFGSTTCSAGRLGKSRHAASWRSGHGVKAISFFNYGPYYAITSDSNSHRPEIYRGDQANHTAGRRGGTQPDGRKDGSRRCCPIAQRYLRHLACHAGQRFRQGASLAEPALAATATSVATSSRKTISPRFCPITGCSSPPTQI